VGRGAALLLNLPPGPDGLIHEIDAARLVEFRRLLESAFAHELAAEALRAGRLALNASSSYGLRYSPQRLVDGDPATGWAAAEGETAAEIRLDFDRPVTFNLFQAREAIALGQRVRGWRLEAEGPQGGWQPVAAGTTIGPKRLARFTPLTARRVRLLLETASAPPALTSLGLFHSPEILTGENHLS
jgi:alpha-L-fucosidase